MVADAKFLFVICQVGAEAALKGEMGRLWPDFRFAFSRPGFVTFKLPPNVRLADDFDSRCILARTSGFSLGRVTAERAETAAEELWKLTPDLAFDHLHVWQRDTALPGDESFEPDVTPLAEEVAGVIVAAPRGGNPTTASIPINQEARPGQRVLDCVLVEPREWWIGWHLAVAPPSWWPGGVPLLETPPEMVSRAYLKISEALAWSRLPIKAGDQCLEIGSAPGGSVQALLERNLQVIGVDPAEMDPDILAHPQFNHVRMRAADLRKRELRDIRWLFADSNIPPQATLDDVESIVTHRELKIRGCLLTLKLSDWSVMELVPSFLERAQSWGYDTVMARQLAFNRREICLAAFSRTPRHS